ncbi:DUF47 family protein [Desulfosoma sp.]|uniref:DUF47 family protein n=1 Tax=Desulfosoma sp. TaxID=2603217 RepID=UPI00404A404A
MFKWMRGNRNEEAALKAMHEHLQLMCVANEALAALINSEEASQVEAIYDLEREGDMVRRRALSIIFEGAFLPYLGPVCVVSWNWWIRPLIPWRTRHDFLSGSPFMTPLPKNAARSHR